MPKRTDLFWIAERVRHEFIAEGYDIDGGCIDLCKALHVELLKKGYEAQIIHGRFRTDQPYDKWGTQPDPCTAIHFWLEVDRLIVDASCDQFNKYLNTPVGQVQVGSYGELRRYKKI